MTRFSGRRAPRHPGGVPHLSGRRREAYSHEVSSAGFWPGSGAIDYPAFYSYAYPEPPGFRTAPVRPEAAFFSKDLSEFILPYDAVRLSAQPDQALLDFLQSTYEAAANAAKWDRDALECQLGGLAWCGRSSPLRRHSACRADGQPVRRATERPQLLRGAIARHIGNSAPAESDACVRQRQW